jgi:hypothetical protein
MDLPDGSRSSLRLLIVLLAITVGVALTYFVGAYTLIPTAWQFVLRRHPALDTIGTRAYTKVGIPGDPFNVAFVGSEEGLQKRMLAAGWLPADPITFSSSLRIAKASVMHKPYPVAPISDLYVLGKKQTYAFEQPYGGDPSKRHHVRFWLVPIYDALERPMWIGAATFDSGVGLSHTTGQITHHIDADVDKERDKLVDDLQRSGDIVLNWIDAFQPEHEGRNGGGDHFVTDGRLAVFSEQ